MQIMHNVIVDGEYESHPLIALDNEAFRDIWRLQPQYRLACTNLRTDVQVDSFSTEFLIYDVVIDIDIS